MEVIASTRKLQGTGASRRLRRAGKVPGVVYGGDKPAAVIELDHNPLFHAMRKEAFHASILDLKIDGNAEQVLLRDYQMHAFRQQIQHIDFQRVDANREIHIRVPLHFVNAELSQAVKFGGAIVSHVMNEVEIACLPRDLPEFIEVDLKDITAGHAVHVKDLKLPAGVRVVAHGADNPVVASAMVPGAAKEEENAAPAAADVPATAQKKPADAAPAKGAAPAKAAPAKKDAKK
ncbi:MAG: 50S ribosomal protein L25/general stress protein Ctc [Burkholderiales bacterium]|nr:50S ribosomal protein L25/general stress protein Ctc [Burkholderiales bacterium]